MVLRSIGVSIMPHWNHRIVRKTFPNGEVILGVVEAFYDESGLIWGFTSDFQEPMVVESDGETVDNLKKVIGWMLKACDQPILDADKIPEPGAKGPGDEEDD